MPKRIAAALVFVAGALSPVEGLASQWWAHVEFLASDRMKGRETGGPEHREAAEMTDI